MFQILRSLFGSKPAPTLSEELCRLSEGDTLYAAYEGGYPVILTHLSLGAGEEPVTLLEGDEALTTAHDVLSSEDPAQRLLAAAYLARHLRPRDLTRVLHPA